MIGQIKSRFNNFRSFILSGFKDQQSLAYRQAKHLFHLNISIGVLYIFNRLVHSFQPATSYDLIFDLVLLIIWTSTLLLIKNKRIAATISIYMVCITVIIGSQLIYKDYIATELTFVHPFHLFQSALALLATYTFFAYKFDNWKVILVIAFHALMLILIHSIVLMKNFDEGIVLFMCGVTFFQLLMGIVGLTFTARYQHEQNQIIEKQRIDLSNQKVKLQRSNQDLEKFAHAIAHDLKEPQRTIFGYTNILQKELANADTSKEDLGEYVDQINSLNNRMSTMIDSLLRFGSIHLKTDELQPVDLNKVFQTVNMNVNYLLKEKNGKLNIHESTIVYGIENLIIQLFQNLVVNGLKYARPGVDPVIAIKTYVGNNQIHIEVIDNGKGIAAEYIDDIFEIFNRAGETEESGTGIGLSICQRIINLHRGKIQVKSTVNKGTCFKVQFPLWI